MKSPWVSELQDVGAVRGVFLVAESEVRAARDDSPYLRMKLQDRTGAIDGLKWRATEAEQQMGRGGSYVLIKGKVDIYQGRLQITVDRIEPPPSEPDPADFLPQSPRDLEELRGELKDWIGTIRHPQVRRLLESLVIEGETGRKFAQAPAATMVHHAYLGGLIEHTVSVISLADTVAAHYPRLNRDLLLAGTILHDFGKIEEYEWQRGFRQSDRGQLVGHICQGLLLINRAMDAIPDFDPLWRMLISHIIVSHHGKLEYGSPKQPMIPEAIALHYLEDLDAKMQIADKELSNGASVGSSPNWTKRNIWLESALFRGVPRESESTQAHDEPGTFEDPFSQEE